MSMMTPPPRLPARTAAAVYPLSSTQRALWLHQQLTPEGVAHTRHCAFRLHGPLDLDALRRALGLLLARHPALRTTFPPREGAPVRFVHAHLAPSVTLDDAALWSQDTVDARLTAQAARPYDLARGPLLRLHLCRRALQVHDVLLTLHDLLADARSLTVLLPDLAALYAAETSGASVPSAPFPPYADDARAHDAWIDGPEGDRLWAYWRRALEDAPPLLALPSSLPHPLSPSEDGAVVMRTLDAALTARLEALADDAGVTLDVVPLSSFCAVLLRSTGHEDLVIGTSLADDGRGADEVGCRDEAIPLRLDLSGEPSFAQTLHRVGEALAEGRWHAGFPFALLVERLAPPRVPGYAPLVQLYFDPYAARPSALSRCPQVWHGLPRRDPAVKNVLNLWSCA